MSPGMKRVAPFLLLCLIAGETAGEQGRERPPDECGDPRRISQSYEVYEGTVVEVVDRVHEGRPGDPQSKQAHDGDGEQIEAMEPAPPQEEEQK